LVGTRFNARGIDDDGNVSNFVETEFLLYANEFTFSFIQTRGSVPVFWEQTALQLSHKIDFSRGPELTVPASAKHFSTLKERYQNFQIVNLLGSKEAEQSLTEAFKYQIRKFEGHEIEYTNFDFHAAISGGNYENVNLIINQLKKNLNRWEYFLQNATGESVHQQLGVMRINCLDCLDRTNHTQR
jgi:synaptojanin